MNCIFDIVGQTPPHLLIHCDGCGAKFFKGHKLECKKGGLVIQRHAAIKFELQDLAARALIPSEVRDARRVFPMQSCAPSSSLLVSMVSLDLRKDIVVDGDQEYFGSVTLFVLRKGTAIVAPLGFTVNHPPSKD